MQTNNQMGNERMGQDFAVLLSVYKKEKAEHLEKALHSITVGQTICPAQIVLVEDGPLTEELYRVIEAYRNQFPDLFDIVALKENMGLGNALHIGLRHCRYDLVARMDSDDICVSDRFEKQAAYMNSFNDIAVCGGHIAEFYVQPSQIITIKRMPLAHWDIMKRMKWRNPMNHVTVMFRKKAVLNAGGYKKLPYLEDYYLWIRMLDKGYYFANLDSVLVKVRTGKDMFRRRGNKEQLKGWLILQKNMYQMRLIGIWEAARNMAAAAGFIYCPSSVKRILYEKLLREKKEAHRHFFTFQRRQP